MNDDHELDPVARLRAADPAVDVEPRDGFADEVIARATAEPAEESASVADLAAERARHRPSWLQIAAVAASIAIVGTAGYALGASTGGATNLADSAAPPISLQSGAGQEGTLEGGRIQADAGAFAGPGPTAMSADSMHSYGFGRNSFTSSGLSTTEGTALAYAFDARAASNADTVAALAAALGVEGVPELKDGSWMVGSQDGTAPSVSVGLDGMLSFFYQNPQINPWLCAEGAEKACGPVGDPPSEETAIERLRALIVAAGRDPEAFEFSSQVWEGSSVRSAQAWQIVDGQRIDQSWSLEIAQDGLVSAYGTAAEIVRVGDYPVVSEQEGFERLSDPRFGAQMTIMPFDLRDPSVSPAEAWVPPTEPPATPTEGASLSWPVNEVEIVSARLGLASQWQPDGSVLIVPAYEFTDAAGGVWSVIAVADSMLDFASE